MSLVTTRNRSIPIAALLIALGGSVWLVSARDTMSTSTFGAIAALLLGTVAVGLNSWRNGQATGSVGQLIHETDVTGASASEVRNAPRR
jgi:hypothetical protein